MFYEAVFIVDCVINFFVDYYEPNNSGNKVIQRDYKKITQNYYKTRFWDDLIPLIPFWIIDLGPQMYLSYLVKVYRIKKGIVLLNVRVAIDAIKDM